MDDLLNKKTEQATLMYLINPNYHFKKDALLKKITPSKGDKKFYKKRIMEQTREMFRGCFLNDNINNVFDNYINTLIEYFKMIDEKDIIQCDYLEYSDEKKQLDGLADECIVDECIVDECVVDDDTISIDSNDDNCIIDSGNNKANTTTADKRIFNISTNVNYSTLDNFVISNPIIIKKNEFIPQRKTIDLKESSLKTKGIKIKKKKII